LSAFSWFFPRALGGCLRGNRSPSAPADNYLDPLPVTFVHSPSERLSKTGPDFVESPWVPFYHADVPPSTNLSGCPLYSGSQRPGQARRRIPPVPPFLFCGADRAPPRNFLFPNASAPSTPMISADHHPWSVAALPSLVVSLFGETSTAWGASRHLRVLSHIGFFIFFSLRLVFGADTRMGVHRRSGTARPQSALFRIFPLILADRPPPTPFITR